MLRYGMVAGVLLSLFAKPANGQSRKDAVPEPQQVAATREALRVGGDEEVHRRLEQAVVANAIAERRAQLQRDTEKLVALVAELKQHIDKSNPNILSMEAIKKAAEIQKLAKSVEDKMKNAY